LYFSYRKRTPEGDPNPPPDQRDHAKKILINYGDQYNPNHENVHATAPRILITADDIENFLDGDAIRFQLPPDAPPIPIGPQNRPPRPPSPPPIPIGPRNQPPPPPGLPYGFLAEIRQTAQV